MKTTKTLLCIAACAAVMTCFTACGDSESSTAGQISLSTTTTTTAGATESVENTEQTTESVADVSTPDESTAAPVSENTKSVAEKARVIYGGFELGTGDSIDAIKDSLGAESAPSTDAASCLTGNIIKEYYYAGMSLQVNGDGKIFAITLNNEMYAGDDVKTVDGVAVGTSEDDAKALLGEPTSSTKTNLKYTDGTQEMTVTVIKGAVDTVLITDSALDS
ncbi:MAG: hypothetical protein IJ561_00605 [Ruminococcus sp.]|nr:hypothetical protein [Ruminococcus sp.]